MPDGPMRTYREKLKSGEYHHDPAQELAIERLNSLHNALKKYKPEKGGGGWRARFGIPVRKRLIETPPQGLYMYGDVGRGKSMVMDLFFDHVKVDNKRRVHFHAFMREVHERLKDWRDKTRGKEADPIDPLADEIASEAWLLCFDEFQVDNIADAMILGRLFEGLFENGVVVVATSNRVPQDLYKNGLQRERFVPFIDMISSKLEVLELQSPTDYRLGRDEGETVYHSPLNEETKAKLAASFNQFTGGCAKPDYLMIKSRRIEVPSCANRVGYFTFSDLCEQPYGAGVYLEIATLFHTIVLEGIPQMSPKNRNEATRFVHLIDALYEHKVKMVCSAEALPQDLYVAGDGSFEFQRTVSRLMEMQSKEYWTQNHLT